MKDQIQVYLLIALFAVAAFRIYQKYFKKDDPTKPKSDSAKKESLPSSSKDDDYEPYSGK